MICGKLNPKLIQQPYKMESRRAIVIWDFALQARCLLGICLKTSAKG